MKIKSIFFRPLLLAWFLAVSIAGCGGSSSPTSTGTTPTPAPAPADPVGSGVFISGTVSAPGSAVAQLEGRNTFFNLALNYVIIPVYADIIGLQPVGNGTAELIRIDDNGNQVGDVLASAPLSITGEYSLELPTGVSLAANLVVRVSSGGTTLRAMVVELAVDINPLSEFVLQKFVDDDTVTLADLPTNQVVALTGRVKEFDITATEDITSMLAKLEADLGELVETEIEDAKTSDDDGTLASAAAGDWNIVSLGLGLHDNEAANFGTFAVDIISSSATLATDDSTPGGVTATETAIQLDTWTNFNFDGQGLTSIYSEIELDAVGEDELFSGVLDAAGNLSLEFPFEEDLQTGDCPMVGWRYPGSTLILENTGNDNGLVAVITEASVRYNTVDTNSDTCPDAIDPNDKDGDEVFLEMLLVLKAGSGMDNTSLSGDYGFVTLATEVSTSNDGILTSSTVGTATMNNGVASIPTDGLHEVGFGRYPGATANSAVLADELVTSDGGFDLSYSVATDGQMQLDVGNVTPFEGWVNEDGSLFGLLNVDTVGTAPDAITEIEQEVMVGIRLPTGLPILEGSVYRLYPLIFGAGTDGFMEITTLGRGNTVTFGAGATTATLDGKVRAFERDTATGPISSFTEQVTLGLDAVVSANGEINLSYTEGTETIAIKGYVSADGSVMVLRLFGSDTGNRQIGLIMAVKQ